MTSLYMNTVLTTYVNLNPDQMDNKIYLNLKKNLEKKVLGKCYKNYGYIMEVYEIINYDDGIIEAENLMASAYFNVKFSCRLVHPLKNKQIVCQVNRVNKVLITAENGPILVIITNDRVNDKLFFTDNNNNIRYKKESTSHILKPKEFVVVTLISTVFNHGDEKIKAIGFLDDIANEQQVEEYYKELYNHEEDLVKKELINYKEYVEEESN